MRWPAALPLLLLIGCTSALPRARRDRDPNRHTAALKLVKDKRPLTTLVALDGTSCAVTPDRFHRIQVGDVVWCVWRSEGGTLDARRGALVRGHPLTVPTRPPRPERPPRPPG